MAARQHTNVSTTETDQSAAHVDCDTANPASFDAVMATADEFGGVDVMVTNAGIVGLQDPLVEYRPRGVSGTDACQRRRCLLRCTGGRQGDARPRAWWKHRQPLECRGTRRLRRAHPVLGAKGAVRLFSYALAAELGPENIRVNTVHPGVIETAMTTEDSPIVGTDEGEMLKESLPLRRFGQPTDVANVITFLASDLAAYVTAESIRIDGGMVNTA